MPSLISALRSIPPFNYLHSRFTSTKLIKRLASGTFWMLIGKASWRLLSVISTIFVARIFGPQGFGEYNMVRSTVDMFSTYAGMRLGVTSTKYVAEFRNTDPERASRILRLTLFVSCLICVIATFILFAASGYLAEHILHHPELATAIAISALLVFFLIYGNIKQRALAGFENFKVLAKISIFHGFVTPVAVIPLAYFWGVQGAISGLVIVSVLVYMLASHYLTKEVSKANFPQQIPLREVRQELPILWKFALPGFLVGLLIAAMLWTGRLLLTQQESGFIQLGLFSAAYMWRAMIIFLPATLGHVVLPVLSETHGSESKQEFNSAISVQVQGTLLVTLPLILLVIGFSAPLSLIFGHKFEGVETIIPILMLSVFFFVINHSVRQVYDSMGRRWINFAMHVVWAATYLYGCLTLVPTMGAVGLAITHLIAEAVLLLLQAVYVDIFLVPSVLRRHSGMFLFSLLLLACCYSVYTSVSGVLAYVAMTGFVIVGLVPVCYKFFTMRS